MIAASYFSISVALIYLVRKRQDLAFNRICLMFAAFILLCGTSHVLDVWTIWVPSYGIEGLVKLGTGLVSLATAVALWFLMPKALAIPSVANLEAAHRTSALELEGRLAAETKLRQRDERFKSLVAGVKEYAIFMLDPAGTIETWNAGAERIFQFEEHEIVGKHFSILFVQEDQVRRHPQHGLEVALRDGTYEVEGIRSRKDASTFYAYVVTTAMFDHTGKLNGFAKVVCDITERREISEKLHQVNAELELRIEARTQELNSLNQKLQEEVENYHCAQLQVQRLNLDLKRRMEAMQALLNVAPVGIALCEDPSCETIKMNSACAEMLNLPVDANASKSANGGERLPFKVLTPDGQEISNSELPMQKALATGKEIRSVELDIIHETGRVVSLYEYATPLFNEEGKVRGCLGVFVDITPRKTAERELAKAKEAAEAADRAKSEFLANMSHEIRTPLNAIVGFGQLLKDVKAGSDEQAQFINSIERNGRALTQLIDDILDLSKVESGHLTTERIKMPLPNLMADLRSTMSVAARNKGIALNIRTASRLPETVITDPMKLRQILINLIGNAIKFTSRGSVEVLVEVVQKNDADSSTLRFTIADTGCGMSTAAQQNLFKPFAQADASTTRRFGGTGLGLVLARRFAQALGGGVELTKSMPGVGSTFLAWVDAGQLDFQSFGDLSQGLDHDAARVPIHERLDGLSILVAEDSPDNQLLIRHLLMRHGANVEIAEDGRQAVDLALGGHYDIILMDLQMPVLDGYGAATELRRRGYDGPIIALSAHAMREEREKGAKAGCNDHLTKPINAIALYAKVREYSRRSGPLH
jgi:PAS domain S-box-containing protein